MTDFQIFVAALVKMPWLLIFPAAIIWTGLVEAVERKWEGR